MPLLAEEAAEMMSAAASLLRHDAGRKVTNESIQALALHLPANNNPPGLIRIRQAAGILAKINANDNDADRSAPISRYINAILTDCSERGGPSHNHIPLQKGIEKRFLSARDPAPITRTSSKFLFALHSGNHHVLASKKSGRC